MIVPTGFISFRLLHFPDINGIGPWSDDKDAVPQLR